MSEKSTPIRKQMAEIFAQVVPHLEAIEAIFATPELNPKLTLLVRAPHLANGGMLFMQDDAASVIATIQRLSAIAPKPLTVEELEDRPKLII